MKGPIRHSEHAVDRREILSGMLRRRRILIPTDWYPGPETEDLACPSSGRMTAAKKEADGWSDR